MFALETFELIKDFNISYVFAVLITFQSKAALSKGRFFADVCFLLILVSLPLSYLIHSQREVRVIDLSLKEICALYQVVNQTTNKYFQILLKQ